MKTDKNLSQIFGTPAIPEQEYMPAEIDEEKPKEADPDPDFDSDFEYSRTNMRDLVLVGKEAIADALRVAQESEEPRAFEVVGSLIHQIAELNEGLVNVHQMKAKIADLKKKTANLGAGTKESKGNVTTNNNAFFVGSTKDLSKAIDELKDKDK